MRILLVSATEMEIAPTLLKHLPVDYIITGVGVAACVYQLCKAMAASKYDLVIQAGIGGSLISDFQPGDTVLVQREVFADAGAIEGEKLLSLFDLGLANRDEWPFINGWLENSSDILSNSLLKKTSGITVNTVSDSASNTRLYKEKYNAGVESMEGAAFHYVCLQESVPFVQLRAISNIVGERDKAKWQVKKAIDNLNAELLQLINNLPGEIKTNR